MLAKRYIFVLILLLFAIGALSSVSASDLNATDKAIGEEVGVNSELEQTDENQLQASVNGTFTELKNKISSSSSDFTLDKDYAYVDSDGKDLHMGINITKSITIRGNNHTVYGNSARVFVIGENCQVSISNVHFINKINDNGVAYSRGGTILNHGNLTLVDCTFKNSYAASLGGAIHSDNVLILQSCEFNNNVASNINESQEPAGGAVSSLNILVAYDCSFNFNRADFGGAIYNEKSAIIVQSSFFYNEAGFSGGAIYNDQYCQINFSSLYLNDAKWGAALYNCEANNCYFFKNIASEEGNNMNEGKMYNCTYPVEDNDYVDVDGVFRLSASQKTITYGSGAKYDVKVTNHLNKIVSGVNVKIIAVNGKTQKVFYAKTNAKGIASFSINLNPKTYSLSISSNDKKYVAALKSSKIIVKKASSKITAKNAKFKVKKTKKYSITLKDSNGKAIKKVKVTISVGGKTYTATTNTNGKATFKLSKLKKKGSFGATIKFGGNSYYNGFSKKVTIKVKK